MGTLTSLKVLETEPCSAVAPQPVTIPKHLEHFSKPLGIFNNKK